MDNNNIEEGWIPVMTPNDETGHMLSIKKAMKVEYRNGKTTIRITLDQIPPGVTKIRFSSLEAKAKRK